MPTRPPRVSCAPCWARWRGSREASVPGRRSARARGQRQGLPPGISQHPGRGQQRAAQANSHASHHPPAARRPLRRCRMAVRAFLQRIAVRRPARSALDLLHELPRLQQFAAPSVAARSTVRMRRNPYGDQATWAGRGANSFAFQTRAPRLIGRKSARRPSGSSSMQGSRSHGQQPSSADARTGAERGRARRAAVRTGLTGGATAPSARAPAPAPAGFRVAPTLPQVQGTTRRRPVGCPGRRRCRVPAPTNNSRSPAVRGPAGYGDGNKARPYLER